MKKVNLENVHGCITELQDCSRGLAEFDHLFGILVDAEHEAAVAWEPWEVKAAMAAREVLGKGATATEIKAGMADYRQHNSEAQKAWERVQSVALKKRKLDRWLKSLEKRQMAAGSANNGHDTLGRYGGGA